MYSNYRSYRMMSTLKWFWIEIVCEIWWKSLLQNVVSDIIDGVDFVKPYSVNN